MAARRKYTEEWDEGPDEIFAGDDAYDRYGGEDLSGDPMLADEKRRGRKPTKKEERELAERLREKEALKAEILAELGAAGYGKKEGEGGEPPEGESEGEKRPSRFTAYLMSFLSGNILSKQEVRRIYPYLLFIALLAFIYIGNVFRMQQLYRRQERLTVEVRELRARSMTIASEKMRSTRQSNIIREIERRGLPLKESLEPNKTIQR